MALILSNNDTPITKFVSLASFVNSNQYRAIYSNGSTVEFSGDVTIPFSGSTLCSWTASGANYTVTFLEDCTVSYTLGNDSHINEKKSAGDTIDWVSSTVLKLFAYK